MTPYRASPPERGNAYWGSQPFGAVMFGGIALGLCAIGAVFLVADISSLVTPTFLGAAMCAVLCERGITRLVAEGRKVMWVRGVLWKRPIETIAVGDAPARVKVTHRNRTIRAHVVELEGAVVAECDDHGEALEISKFVEQALR